MSVGFKNLNFEVKTIPNQNLKKNRLSEHFFYSKKANLKKKLH